MQHLLSLKEIFEGKVFRIPDYQRGYAWKTREEQNGKNHQLDDFWEDLNNLQDEHIHYTGVITVERAKHTDCLVWQKEGRAFAAANWQMHERYLELSFAGQKFQPFYVVDGQQRLLTIATLLAAVCEHKNFADDRAEIEHSFLLVKHDGEECYLFGYEVDLPSHHYLIQKIYKNQPSEEVETAYTDNLLRAKEFFTEKIREFSRFKLQKIVKKVTANFQFNFYEVDEKLDAFVVFETMNYRGRPLSKLELLKNRLLYLTTLLPPDTHSALREKINASWKLIHEWLAKNRSRDLDEDEFLRIHWIMYFRHQQKGYELGNLSEMESDLLDDRFTKRRVRNGQLVAEDIYKYVENLGVSVRKWFELNFPSHAASSLPKKVHDWVERINMLRPQSLFRPIILALLQKTHSESEAVGLLKEIERHEFLVFALACCRADANQAHFYRRANYFFTGHLEIYNLIQDIRSKAHKFYNQRQFQDNVEKWFDDGDGDDRGYFQWPHIEYFLLEYENHLRAQIPNQPLIGREKHPFERVYPESNRRDLSWEQSFDDVYSTEKCRKLCNSLGNLVLLSRPRKNQELSYTSFNRKKRHPAPGNQNEETGYFYGSFSEQEVASCETWTHTEILERGVKMLGFMVDRWNIPLAEEFRRTLTQVNFGVET
jgi:hypothetical protein